jgi:hypothetical protein
MLCGTAARPCPKLLADSGRTTQLGTFRLPPPCIYLFPRTVPDARNNPKPPPWKLDELTFLSTLAKSFNALKSEVISVALEVSAKESEIQRRTIFMQNGRLIDQSKPTTLKRARKV